jgi:16S rRNA (guanine966-N2)-methyltransferase
MTGKPKYRKPGSSGRCEVRIIGGVWRGRKLHFPPGVTDLRPTPDRVRETLFNWLREAVSGSRCLDLYAGSGALGFEALSRGAREVVFVERDAQVARYLVDALDTLGCRHGVVHRVDALAFLRARGEPFDVVFLDPPFGSQVLAELLTLIDARGWLRPGGFAYLEQPAAGSAPLLPSGWSLHRSKRAGEVGYHLAQSPSAGAAPAAVASTGIS